MIQWLDEVFVEFPTVIDTPLSLRQCTDIFRLGASIVEQRPPPKKIQKNLDIIAISGY